jgi:hypothetical protein
MVWAVMRDTISTPSAVCPVRFLCFALGLLIQLQDDDDVTSLTRVWPCQRRRLGHAQSGTRGHGSDDVRQPETSG